MRATGGAWRAARCFPGLLPDLVPPLVFVVRRLPRGARRSPTLDELNAVRVAAVHRIVTVRYCALEGCRVLP